MPRKQHTYHYIYKITCNITNRFYIGMHSTSNLEDGYFGSGKVLKRSINKYGKENHSIEILELLSDRISLKTREREIVNEDLLSDPLCMNLKIGGEGGNLSINGTYLGGDKFNGAHKYWKDNVEKMRELTSNRTKLLWEDPTYREKILSKFSFSGKSHTLETRNKIGEANSINQRGSNNSQFGKIWIFSNTEQKSIKIKKDDLLKYLELGWKKGRRFNFS